MLFHATPRLRLEGWRLEDFAAFAQLARDPEVMRFIAEGEPWPDSRIGWFLGRQSALQETLGYCNWKLKATASDGVLGFCGLAPLASIGEVEIGWWLRPEHWGQGLAREAATYVVRAAFEDYALPRIVARAYQANTRSIKLMQHLGMTFARNLGTGPAGNILLYQIEKKHEKSEAGAPL